jgi:hypothetical protein
MRTTGLVLVVAFIVASSHTTSGRQVVGSLTGDQIDEAIRLGADGDAAKRALAAYVIQSHRASGDGPRLGEFSTPFSRVVRRSAAEKSAGRQLLPGDVPTELLAPEVHVIAVVQETADGNPASIRAITVWRNGEEVPAVRTTDLNATYRNTFNVQVSGEGVLAVFPADVVATATQIIVHLDKIAKGSSVLSGCKDCIVPLSPRLIK